MSIRCFVSCLTDFTPKGGSNHFIAAVIDQHFIIRDGKLVARGYADLHAGLFHNYTKDIILEISYDRRFIVNVFWESEWKDGDGMSMTQGDRDKIKDIYILDEAEGLIVKDFRKECDEMLERLLYYHWDEVKQVLHIEGL